MPETTEKTVLVPSITPELLAANEAEQQKWRERFQLPQSGQNTHLRALINSNLEILEALGLQTANAAPEVKQGILAQIKRFRDETADAFAALGEFEKAAEMASSNQKQELYADYQAAIDLDDSEWCEHPRWRKTDGKTEQVAYREFDFFSEAHGRQVSMMRCNECGFRNAADLSRDLQQLSNHRREILSQTEGLSRREANKKISALVKADISQIFR